MVVDPLNLKHEVLTVLVLHQAYLEQISASLAGSWETDGSIVVKPFERGVLEQYAESRGMVPNGKALLKLAAHHFDRLEEHVGAA